MTQPTEGTAKLIDQSDNLQIGEQQSAITTVTITGLDVDINNVWGDTELAVVQAMIVDIAALKTAQDLIISALEAHGLIADN